ncbi:MAG TPA: VCBS repeat-containing protein [archaeon]|nr:VCBS repeat-containing protein [archaeon]
MAKAVAVNTLFLIVLIGLIAFAAVAIIGRNIPLGLGTITEASCSEKLSSYCERCMQSNQCPGDWDRFAPGCTDAGINAPTLEQCIGTSPNPPPSSQDCNTQCQLQFGAGYSGACRSGGTTGGGNGGPMFNAVWVYQSEINTAMLQNLVSHKIFNVFLSVGYPNPSDDPALTGIVPDGEIGILVSQSQVAADLNLLASVDSRLRLWAWVGTFSSGDDATGHANAKVDVSTSSNRAAIIKNIVKIAQMGFYGVQDDTEDITANSADPATGQMNMNMVNFWNEEATALHNIGVKLATFTPAVWYNFNTLYLPQMTGMDYHVTGIGVNSGQSSFNTQMTQFMANTNIPVIIDIESDNSGNAAELISWIDAWPVTSYPNVVGFALYNYGSYTSDGDWAAWDSWALKDGGGGSTATCSSGTPNPNGNYECSGTCCCSETAPTPTPQPKEMSFKYIQVDNDMPPRIDFPNGPGYFFGLAMGDLTGDGFKDIVAHNMLYKNPGGNMEGTWQRIEFPWDWTDAFAIVDVDGDQYGDVIAEGEEVSGNVNIYWLEEQNTGGTSWSRTLIGNIPKTDHLWSQEYEVAQIVPGGKPEILIGGGDGIYYFSIPSNPASGNWPRVKIIDDGYGYATGDIDGDGYLDVVGGHDSVNVAWWKNPGDGTGFWQRYEIGQINNLPDRFAIGDFDKDGNNDIAVSEEIYPVSPDASIYWFKAPANPLTGSWTKNTLMSDACSLNSMSVGDMDLDGNIDIVSGEMGNPSCQSQKRIIVFVNDGTGNFENMVADTGKESHLGARVSDLDGDGDLDIVSIGWNEYQYVHVWRNDLSIVPITGELSFTHVIVDDSKTLEYLEYPNCGELSSCAYLRSVGDVNDDDYDDIIAAIGGVGLAWYRYPNWDKYTLSSFDMQSGEIDSADIDSDGYLDVVSVDGGGNVLWFENPMPQSPTNTWASHHIGTDSGVSKDLMIADMNNDGKLDVVSRTPETASVFLQNSPTSWTKVKTITFQHSAGYSNNKDGLDVADLDGDGNLDIVLNGFWIGTPDDLQYGAWTEYNIADKWWNQDTGFWGDDNTKVSVGDIDGNGRLDVVIAQNEMPGYPISWYSASDPKNGPWTEHIIVDPFGYCHTLEVADMDLDGDLDVVAGRFEREPPDSYIPAPFPLILYLNNGDGSSWESMEIYDDGIYSGVLGDIGNDGDLDIIASRSYWKGPVEIWENNLIS